MYRHWSTTMEEEALMLIDKYLGDLIEEVVYKYKYNVDLEDEYEELLRYVFRRLAKAWFKGKDFTFKEFERALKNARRRRKQLEIVLSYLISRYAAKNGPIYIKHEKDWYDEMY
jgi:hypothetical protein